MSAKVERIARPCEECGAVRYMTPGQLARPGKGRFCSRKCLGLDNVRRMNATRRSPKEYAQPPVQRGSANGKWVPPIDLVCAYCGLQYTAKPHRVGGPEARGRYCSRSCRDAYRHEQESGPNSPLWVGGQQTYRGRGWKAIRAVIVAEQEGICAHCGKYVGPSLPVNHIRPFREFTTAEEANQRENLIGLCQPCHMRAEPRRRRHSRAP